MPRGRRPSCPYCGAGGSIAKGVRRTATLGDRRLRLCRKCGRKFTVRTKARIRERPIELAM